MTQARGWSLPEQHLLPDALVAFVDGELSPTAHERASAHIAKCPFCAAEASSQRQARAAVRSAQTPSVPASLLAALRSIPQDVDLPTAPDGLAVTEDGQFVAIVRTPRGGAGRGADPHGGHGGDDSRGGDSRRFGSGRGFGVGRGFGSGRLLGDSEPLGTSSAILGHRRGRRGRHGASVVVSGLVLGALALALPQDGNTVADTDSGQRPSTPPLVANAPVTQVNAPAAGGGQDSQGFPGVRPYDTPNAVNPAAAVTTVTTTSPIPAESAVERAGELVGAATSGTAASVLAR
ncbi:anti-sigma factor family protein [Goodfellowiella coeruleoviolacea]|uniref:Zinc-finger n=1 Tax=Goodfellowiella coeruleoviolacea TaxID=334858 RepID=A0AAE3GE12_9PSEU|nr:hypothetical protein [Goodfellowiella coeruleoviolacea]MCP2165584.1 putative zinc-finger [Goodfellowiella coeruleoviolacea]